MSRGWTQDQWNAYYNSDEYKQWVLKNEEQRAEYDKQVKACREREQPLAEEFVKLVVDDAKTIRDVDGVIQDSWWIKYDGYEYELLLRRQEPRKPLP